MHGTTAHMLQNDIEDENLGNFNMHISLCWEWDVAVAINRSDYEIMKMYDVNKHLTYIHDAVDLERYPLEGTTIDLGGSPTLISTDIIRNNKNPAYYMWAMKKIHERLPAARLEVCSLPLSSIVTWRNIIMRASEPVLPNKIHPYFMVKDLRPLIRGADIGCNTNVSGIPSRATLEQMALGKPVISYSGEYTPYHAYAMDTSSIADAVCKCWEDLEKDRQGVTEQTRAYAEEHFDMDKAVAKFTKLYEGAGPEDILEDK